MTARTPGALSSMALCVCHYLWVQEDPRLAVGWLETAVKGAGSDDKRSGCEFQSLLVAAVAVSFHDNLGVLEPALLAVGGLAEMLPAMVRRAGYSLYLQW